MILIVFHAGYGLELGKPYQTQLKNYSCSYEMLIYTFEEMSVEQGSLNCIVRHYFSAAVLTIKNIALTSTK